MSRTLVAALALSAALALPALAEGYKIVDRFKMPDGGWDYASFDPDKGRVYWSRNEGFTDVIDVKTGKLSQLKSTGNGHLAVPVAGTTLVVVPLRMPAKTIRSLSDAVHDRRFPLVLIGGPPGDHHHSPEGGRFLT